MQKLKNILFLDEDIDRVLDLFLQQLEIINDHNEMLMDKSILQVEAAKTLADKTIKETNHTELFLKGVENSDRKESNIIPMSLIQKRLYSYLLLNEEDPYNMVLAIKVKGKIDIQKLEVVLRSIIQRHESLRTRIFEQDGELKQEILEDIKFDVKRYQWESTKNINDMIASHITRFKLSCAPLFEALFFEAATGGGILVFNFHHTVSDGLSVNIFIDELKQIYEGHNLPRPHKQYRDYVQWENSYLESEKFRESEQYWLGKLDSVSTKVNLPLDFYSEKRKGLTGDSLSMTLDADFTQQIKIVATECKCSLFMVLLAAFQILLSKMTNEDDIAVATTLANRSEWDFENVIGMFVNTGVLRNQVDDGMQLADFLEKVKNTCLQAYQHMSYPYNLLLNKLGVKGEDGFNVMFVYERANRGAFDLSDIELENYDYKPDIQEFEITMEILEDDSKLHLYLRYQRDLFKPETIQTLLNRYRKVIEEITLGVDKTIGKIELVDEYEKNRILKEFNDTVMDYPKDNTIVELFEKQVRDKPHNIAVVFDDQTMTYEELNQYANCIAEELIDMGVRQNDYVALLCEKSVEIVAALLGILKVGGAYVPIDHKYPQSRIQFILQDCNPRAVLTYKTEIETEYPVVKLENLRDRDGGKTNPELLTGADDLAYVIYTSGTTGVPKGSMITNRNVVRLVKNTNYVKLTSETVILQTGSIAFDASTFEIWGALLNGGKLYIEETETLLTPGKLKEQIQQEQINTLWLTSSLFNQMISEDSSTFDSLQYLLIGGEKLSKSHVEKMTNRGSSVKVINGYGPTENTTFTTTYEIPANFINIPIGKPIANTTCYIMNRNKLCGVGMRGELCIGGDGVAKGYLNQPVLTLEKFIDNPFGEGKLYRSGDMARWLPDGNIEFLGRNDEQIKIRGFRVELGEIETAIRNTELVKDAVAIIRGDAAEDKVICAYLVSEKKVDLVQIKEDLRKILPAYMIPTFIMQIERIPVTRNGKIDKKNLIEIKVEGYAKEYISPRNERERNLVQVFEEILGVEKAGIKDNFFELGGDSIKAIRIISKMREAGYELNIRDIMNGYDLESIAVKAVENREVSKYEQGEVIGMVSNTPIMKMFFEMQLPKPGHFNLAMMIKKESGFDETVVRKALVALAVHHDVIRAVCRENILEIIDSKSSALYELRVVDLTEETNVEARVDEICTEIQSGMDLIRGPLLRAGLFRTDKGDHLMLCLHHLVVDGVSRRILLEDFKTAYSQLEAGREVVLPTKTASFKEWSEELGEYAKSSQIQKEKAYWIKINETAKEHNILHECSRQDQGTGNITLKFSKDQTKQLLYKAGRAYNTEINDLLLCALGLSIRDWKNQNQVSVKLEGHGREAIHKRISIDRTVGWFTCTYPIVLESSSDLGESIISTKEMLRRVPNHGISYGILCPDEKPTELCFNYLGDFDSEFVKDDIITPSSYPTGVNVSDVIELPDNIILDGYCSKDVLTFIITYNKNKYEENSIKKFCEYFKKSLKAVIAHCKEKKEMVKTASDYRVYDLSDKEFRWIEEQVGKENIDYIKNLTPMQEGMLFHKIYNETSTEYVIQSVMQIKGKLDYDLVRKSTEFLAKKYAILRTVFLYRELRKSKQVALKNREIEVNVIPISEEAEKHQFLEEIKQSDIKRGFDLYQDSLLRITLAKCSDDETAMIWSIHHIIVDGWCISLLKRDFMAYYHMLEIGKSEKEVTGRVEKERGEVTPYSQYLNWLEEKDIEEGLRYWERLLEDYEEVASIESIGEVKQVYDSTSESEKVILDQKSSAKIRKMASEYHVTINTIAEAAWGIVLQNYSGKNDVVFGKVVSGRNVDIPGIEQSVGLFINTIPVRVMSDSETKVSQMVEGLQKQAMESDNYDFCPLVEIQNKTVLRGDLFKTLFVFENYYIDNSTDQGFDGIEISEETTREETNYALTIAIYEADVINCEIIYNPNIYTAPEIKLILKRFILVLGELSGAPEKNILDLAVIDEEEKDTILRKFNETAMNYPKDRTIAELFEEQVRDKPYDIAVVFDDQTMTYEELNQYANCIAEELIDMGVRQNDYVALLCEKSVEIVAALLGILKVGGAYVPIDHKYPQGRIQFILQDCNPRAVLTYKTEIETEYPVVKIENLRDRDGGKTNPELLTGADDLAYVIYTSGTTGVPKGSMITNRSVVRLVKNTNYVKLTSETAILQTGAISFDASTFEIWGALLNGGKVCLADTEILLTPEKLKGIFKKEKINTLFMTTALYNQMVTYDSGIFSSLKYLLFGGEKTSAKYVKMLAENRENKHIKFSNVYGPTENTTFTTYYPIDLNNIWDSIPIGKPIANTTCYIMNRNKLCGVGMRGELCIGGDGVAKGYLNQPVLTLEKFIDNPFGEGKLYRSGDMGRWLPDGNIEYLGRNDEQIKIRGFRVELGEIETAIRNTELVKDAVAIIRGDAAEDKVICAYLVSEKKVDLVQIKEDLRKILPAYMIPTFIMQIERIPVTRNGKIDKKNLIEIKVEGYAKEYISPRNERERNLVQVFEEILGVEKAGIKDNFFELGGDSIKAIRIISKMREAGYELNIRDIMNGYDLESIAVKAVENREVSKYEQGEVIGMVSNTPIMKMFFEMQLPKPGHFNLAMMIKKESGFDETAVRKALVALAVHHDVIRAVCRENILEIIDSKSSALYELRVVDLTEETNVETRVDEICTEIQSGMDLVRGPLLRAGLFRTDKGDHLMLCLHHLVVDGVSWRILLEDFKMAYEQVEAGKKVILPTKTASFKEWSEALEEYAKSLRLQKEKAYWMGINERVEEYNIVHECSCEDQRTGNISLKFDKDQTRQLLYEAGQAYNTEINDLLLCALGLSVRKWKNQEQVSVKLEGHGREVIHKKIDIDRTVGWFTCAYPIILESGANLRESIINTKEMLRRVPNHGIGYGVLYPKDKQIELCFNYLGDFNAESTKNEVITLSPYPTGADVPEDIKLLNNITLNGLLSDDRLIFTITYNKKRYRDESIKKFGAYFKESLELVIAHCKENKETVKTASDYGVYDLSDNEFRWIEEQVGKENIYYIKNLTPMQEGMLFHKIYNEASTEYVIQSVMQIKGKLDYDLVRNSTEFLAKKYDILRTVFLYRELRKSKQVAIKNREIEVNVIYISEKTEKYQFLEEIKQTDIKRGFDLDQDSLLRITLVKWSDDETAMIWSIHHIIVDGWCISLLKRDFMVYYRMLASGNTKKDVAVRLEKERKEIMSYSQYLDWLEERDIEEGLGYWERLLENYEEVASIEPIGEVKQAYDSTSESERVILDQRCSTRIRKMASDHHVTINTIAETAWGIVLQNYSGKNDVVFGKVVSGRNAGIAGIEQSVGLFINTVPVRVTSDSKTKVSQLVEILQRQAVEGGDYDFCPLVEIQNKTVLRGDLFKTLFVFENYYTDASADQGLSSIEIHEDTSREETNYELNVIVYETDVINCQITYNPNIYTASEIKLILKRFALILSEISEGGDRNVSELTIVDGKERDIILRKFNGTAVDYPKDKTIVEVFEDQVRNQPHNIALEFNGEIITYVKLNWYANCVAKKLMDMGVRQNDYVALLCEKGVEVVVALLGILKVGGVYVPIDHKYPEDRIQFVLQDCNPKVMLTYKTEVKTEYPVVTLESFRDWDGGENNPKAIAGSDDLAYVIYTSGTTGVPKGSMITNRNVVRLVKNTNYVKLTSETVILQTGSIAFDASTFEIWGALLNGGKLYIEETEALLTPGKLKERIQQEKINTLWLTSSLFNQMISEDSSTFDSLQYLLIGGEKLSKSHVEKMTSRGSSVKVINGYGPTENTTFTTTYEIPANFINIPIGKPIANTTCYIMNGNKLCGVGMRGELYIGGDGVAKGYLNQPELTLEKFIDNPFGEGKLYRSGDMGRWLPDGNIEYLGRNDEQIKIRGFRVELGEIETAIRNTKLVKDAVAIVQKDKLGDTRICAYFVAHERITSEKVKYALRKTLPAYMIPMYMMQIEQIPVTINGKTDKKALPTIEIEYGQEHVTPRNETERLFCSIVEDILDIKGLGITENLFEAGMDSIKIARIVSQLKSFGVDLSIQNIFYYQTIKDICDHLVHTALQKKSPIGEEFKNFDSFEQIKNYILTQTDTYESTIIHKKPVNQYPVTSIQELSKVLNLGLSGTIIQFDNVLYTTVFGKSITNLVKTYGILRSVLVKENERMMIQEYELEEFVNIPFVDLSSSSDELKQEVINYIVNDLFLDNAILDERIYHKLLYKIITVKFSEEMFKVYIPASHLIFDGMSGEIIKDFLKKAYRNNGNTLINEPVLQYADYVKQINQGPICISETEILEQFDLKRFSRNFAALVENDIEELEYFRISLIPDRILTKEDQECMWDIAIQLFFIVARFNYHLDEIPFALLHTGRRYMDKNFFNTLGECIDILPMVYLENMKNFNETVRKRIELAYNKNINFATLLDNSDIKHTFKEISSIFEKINFHKKKLMIFNFLGLYDDIVSTGEQLRLNKALKRISISSRVVDFSYQEDRIVMSIFCRKGQKEKLETELQNRLLQLLI